MVSKLFTLAGDDTTTTTTTLFLSALPLSKGEVGIPTTIFNANACRGILLSMVCWHVRERPCLHALLINDMRAVRAGGGGAGRLILGKSGVAGAGMEVPAFGRAGSKNAATMFILRASVVVGPCACSVFTSHQRLFLSFDWLALCCCALHYKRCISSLQ